jgi:hypothetical protein
MIGGRRNAASVSLALIDTVPSIACALPEADSDIRAAASPMARTWSINSSPLGVSVSPRPTRSNSATPSSRSSAVTWRPSVGCAMPSARAAADSEPSSAVTRNARARFQSKLTDLQSMRKCISYRHDWSIYSA